MGIFDSLNEEKGLNFGEKELVLLIQSIRGYFETKTKIERFRLEREELLMKDIRKHNLVNRKS